MSTRFKQLPILQKKLHLIKLFLFVFVLCSTTYSAPVLHAEFKGKVDVSPTYIHIDVLESGKTRHRMDMPAIKVDSAVFFSDGGWCLKPNLLYGANKGDIFSTGLGFGHYTPLTEWFALTPVIGAIYSELHTTTQLSHPVLGKVKSKEAFASVSGYIAMEANINFSADFRCAAVYQYSWSKSHTKLKLDLPPSIPNIITSNDHTQGSSYSFMIEKDLTKQWSINVGAAYNVGLSKEKHGLRAYGAKLGLAYWF